MRSGLARAVIEIMARRPKLIGDDFVSELTVVWIEHALEQARGRGVLAGTHGFGHRRPLDLVDPARLLPARAAVRGVPGAARRNAADPRQPPAQARQEFRAGQGAVPGATSAL